MLLIAGYAGHIKGYSYLLRRKGFDHETHEPHEKDDTKSENFTRFFVYFVYFVVYDHLDGSFSPDG